MKKFISKFVLSLVLSAATSGWAAVINFTGGSGSFSAGASPGAVIPDFPGAGLAYGLNFNFAEFTSIQSVSVTLNISGGYNGDLYVFLSHDSGFAVLLNRVGANASGEDGYSTAGFNNITLAMTGTDIHTVAAPITGNTYASDGRADYTSNTRNNTLNVLSGANPNGEWTLFFGDEAGLNTSTLDSWSVDIQAVPEPTTWAGILFGALFGGVQVVRRWRAARRSPAMLTNVP